MRTAPKCLLFLVNVLAFQLLTKSSDDLVSGQWRCIGRGFENEDLHFVLKLKQVGENVKGTVQVGDDVLTINGSIRGSKMELVVVTEDNRYVSIVTVNSGKLSATWKDLKGDSGTWEGERVSPSAN
jgi:hypothetical protein